MLRARWIHRDVWVHFAQLKQLYGLIVEGRGFDSGRFLVKWDELIRGYHLVTFRLLQKSSLVQKVDGLFAFLSYFVVLFDYELFRRLISVDGLCVQILNFRF